MFFCIILYILLSLKKVSKILINVVIISYLDIKVFFNTCITKVKLFLLLFKFSLSKVVKPKTIIFKWFFTNYKNL